MPELLIKNGVVYDPANKIIGEKMDIFVKDGKIGSDAKKPEVIDAGGRLVMPGGVEGHSHIAGGKVNSGRLMRPEDGRRGIEPKGKITRSYSGCSVPNVYATGYRYAKMGYTFLMEAAMPPLTARHTHEELEEIPIVDKGAIPLLDNHWMVMECIKSGDMDKLAAYISWMIKATKGYGIKIVNPGGVEAWAWGKNVSSINDRVPNFDVSPSEIIGALAEINERLNLPHSIHIHCNNLGHPGNYNTTLETFKVIEKINRSNRRQVMHAAHAQFHSYGGSNWGDFESKADEIAKYVNSHDNLTCDIGAVMFCETTTMTADGPMEFDLHKLSRRKWSNNDVELETGGGIIPILYSPKVGVNVIQWAIGLELALLVDDPWKVFLTTDHPNGCPFTFYPLIISLLMSKKKREEAMSGVVSDAINKRAIIPSIDRELDWNDIAVMTRSGPAKILGLDKFGKGHIGVGADADIAIYNIMPEEVDPSVDYAMIEDALSYTAYTIKGGEIVVKDKEIVSVPTGRTFFVDPEVDKSLTDAMLPDLEEKFKEYYSVNISNYPVQDAYLPHTFKISTKEA
ncbi:MAG: formylmethanofuran dehydrogenase subunit A [Halobacteriota archaeon]|nr:formylmethanofuran dehydrogenase subunit A [Halobacteriota archaeon]